MFGVKTSLLLEYCLFVFLLLLFFIPTFVSAAVTINEVAWMGNEVSANDEWIELYNDSSSSVVVDGWSLSDGMNLQIELAGTVGAGAYAVLERTDDTSAPGNAFLIYTGSLINTGATLTLKRSDGSIEDQVAGGENWQNIGGDNVTKETAQYTTSGWVTGTPTPGTVNVDYTLPPEKTDDNNPPKTESKDNPTLLQTTTSSHSTGHKTQLAVPNTELVLTMTAPTTVYVHQPVPFSIKPSGISKVLLNSVQYSWNLGDLTTSHQKDFTHQYEYPGQYVVMVEGKFAKHKATIRQEITVLPVNFSITKNENGDIQINNDAQYEVDVSGYSVRGKKSFIFPDKTIILPKATLTVARKLVGNTDYVWFFDQAQMIVATTLPEVKTEDVEIVNIEPIDHTLPTATVTKTVPAVSQTNLPVITIDKKDDVNFGFNNDADTATKTVDVVAKNTEPSKKLNPTNNQATVNQAQLPISGDKLPYIGLVGLLVLGVLALYATKIK